MLSPAGPMPGWLSPQVPGLELSPRRCSPTASRGPGQLKFPAHAGDGLRLPQGGMAHHPALRGRDRRAALRRPGAEPLPQPDQPYTGVHAGRWPVHYDPGDIARICFQDPADNAWHALGWEHAQRSPGRSAAEALAYARRLALPRTGSPRPGGRWRNCWSSGAPGWPATGPSGGWPSAPPSSGPPGWSPAEDRPRRSQPCRQSPPGPPCTDARPERPGGRRR